ncbi:hypothetical protein ALI44B_12410 [Leifsonia sp. ALI-44-B]|nr:hypothetical protein ALI44B_12410 [Leifsonia sp. ALI-44-B]
MHTTSTPPAASATTTIPTAAASTATAAAAATATATSAAATTSPAAITAPSSAPASAAAPDAFDTLLGPAANRYFGTGYRRIDQKLLQLADTTAENTDPAEPTSLAASGVASITYPEDWSTKGGSARVPHLSTLDALALAAELAEAYLRRIGVSSDGIEASWLEQFAVRAGATPLERVDAIPVALTVSRAMEATARPDEFRTVLACRIGSLSGTVTLRHPAPSIAGLPWSATLGAMREPRIHTTLFRSLEHVSSLSALDETAATLDMEHTVRPSGTAPRRAAGLEARYWPSIGLTDAAAIGGQMAQALIYAGDEVARDNTDTLWMRRATFTATSPVRVVGVPQPSRMIVTRRRSLPHDGRTLHSVDVEAGIGGIAVTSSLAYFAD